jgi:GAF domain-containing protein/HAMP domain-containing protein
MTSTLINPAERARITFSLRNKLIIGFSLLSAFTSFITARGIYTNLQKGIIEGFQRRTLSFVQVAALQQNGDDIFNITSIQSPIYTKYIQQNQKIRESDSDIKDVFILRKDAHGLYYVVDSSDPEYQRTIVYNDRYLIPSPLLETNFDTMKKAIVEQEIRTNKNGSYLSAYVPLFSQDGTRVGVIGVDILANTVIQQQNQLIFQSAVIFLIALSLGVFFGYVVGNALTEPVITLAKGARTFAGGNLNERVVVKTGDEIGDLAQTFNYMANELQELVGGLEERVAQRTRELEGQQRIVLRRSLQFEGINRVARAISSTRNLSETLPQITRLISDQFGFYHVGIFLNDPLNQYTLLSAANSEGGQAMLARGHQLKIGEQGIVGNATSTGRPRIALNVGDDSVYFNNPDLPGTRSEMALPLISNNQVIGALDIQSTEANAFSSEDIEVLKTLADQVSLAIQNARLFDQTQKALLEAEAVSRQNLQKSWSRLPKERNLFGYKYSITGVTPLEEHELPGQFSATKREIAVPINLRGETIGTLAVQFPHNEKIKPDQIDLIKAVAERVAISAENARLFDDANRRADREKVISDVTTKIGESVRMENILKTTARELNQLLDGAEVLIKLKTDSKETR